jgi:hypothetical protein
VTVSHRRVSGFARRRPGASTDDRGGRVRRSASMGALSQHTL